MAAKQYVVPLVNRAGEKFNGVFILGDYVATRKCHLTLQYSSVEIAADASVYFEAMCQIRMELENQRLRPVCFGTSENVWPSGMCRGMAMGLKAYKQELGRRAMRTDLVMIFDTALDVRPVTVEAQRHFHERWLQSLGVNFSTDDR
jgi:hypothetical protein